MAHRRFEHADHQGQSVPDVGDVVIGEEWHNATRRFVLHTVPGPDQCIVAARNTLIEDFRVERRSQVRP